MKCYIKTIIKSFFKAEEAVRLLFVFIGLSIFRIISVQGQNNA